MSRIDDALGRSGLRSRNWKSTAPSSGSGTFDSPWATDGSGAPPARNSLRQDEKLEASTVIVRPFALNRVESGWRERLVVGPDRNELITSQFERLAATLLDVRRGQKLQTLMITSAVPGDGKTLTSLNLALVLSEAYRRRVLLIECDLRRPSLAQALNLAPTPGVGDALRSKDTHAGTFIELTERLVLLPAGRPDADPLSGLASEPMQALLSEASQRFDWVIVDTPPVGITPDAGLLCPLVDAVLLVIRERRSPYPMVEKAVEVLGRERILGIVLNATEESPSVGYGDYYSPYRADVQEAGSDQDLRL